MFPVLLAKTTKTSKNKHFQSNFYAKTFSQGGHILGRKRLFFIAQIIAQISP
jgi:hypothetical protein